MCGEQKKFSVLRLSPLAFTINRFPGNIYSSGFIHRTTTILQEKSRSDK
ncbi:hypothetical protein D1AOALGA4SA_312 [Olavius algarvensis Delta 1 endosymbiont]|nr:hypothetical protein D1AOALGA4SA_312 [Olavius algarvensis Delta 1 endosymbiont]